MSLYFTSYTLNTLYACINFTLRRIKICRILFKVAFRASRFVINFTPECHLTLNVKFATFFFFTEGLIVGPKQYISLPSCKIYSVS